MANEAFVHGFDLGYGRAEDQRQHKQALSDQEFLQKNSQLLDQQKAIQQKYASTLDANGKPTDASEAVYNELLNAHKAIADHWHPDNNPGMIAKLGHHLTDALKITNPQDRAAKQQVADDKKTATNASEVGGLVTAAPLNLSQEAVQGAQAKSAAATAGYQADLKAFKTLHPNATPEELSAVEAEFQQKYFGENVRGNWVNVAGTIDGNPTNLLFNKTSHQYLTQGGSPVPPELVEKFAPTQKQSIAAVSIAGWQEALKKGETTLSYLAWAAEQRRLGAPPTSGENEYAASYAHAYGLKSVNDLTPEDWDYIKRRIAYDRAIPQTTTANTLKQNFQQQWVPIQETNTKSPGGPMPMPPRGKPVNNTPPPPLSVLTAAPATTGAPSAATPPTSGAPAASAPSASASGAPSATPPPAAATGSTATSPRALKEEAKGRNPKVSSSASSGSQGANASVKVGDPVFAAPSKEYKDALTAYHGAIERVKTMDKNLKSALNSNPPDQQAMLSLVANHIGMTLGAQKGARINQAVWNEAVASAPWVESEYAKWFHTDPSTGDHVFDGFKAGVTLTPGQMKQMVELAHERKDTLEESLKTIEDDLNSGVTNPSKKSAIPKEKTAPDVAKSKGSVSVAQAMTLPKYKGKTKEQVSDAITKQGYIPIE